jgi:hypothetical protein
LIHGGTISSGSPIDRPRGRRVLDELHQVVLEHDLARREGEVPPDFEGFEIGLADGNPALAAIEILDQVVEAVHQIFGVACRRFPEHGGIRQQEVSRGEGVGDLLRNGRAARFSPPSRACRLDLRIEASMAISTCKVTLKAFTRRARAADDIIDEGARHGQSRPWTTPRLHALVEEVKLVETRARGADIIRGQSPTAIRS